MTKRRELEGQKFGNLTVLRRLDRIKKHQYWEVRCRCGTKHRVRQDNMLRGNTSNCWRCYHRTALEKLHYMHLNWILTADYHALAPLVVERLEKLKCL